VKKECRRDREKLKIEKIRVVGREGRVKCPEGERGEYRECGEINPRERKRNSEKTDRM